MAKRQARNALQLESRWVGGLPLVNHVLDRLHFGRLLARTLPAADARVRLDSGQVLDTVLRSLVVNQRHPVYKHGEWVADVEPALLGLPEGSAADISDDRVGRALDQLFLSDHASLLTELSLRAVREFEIDLERLHNDSTTITFSGQYAGADGHLVGGRPTVRINYGHNKDHRPDLKQLLFVLTVSADGAVPVHYRALDGNTSDTATHIETWNTLRQIAGRSDFLYVADCKLCSRASLAHIAKQGGRFITVLPRNRREDHWFRHFVQTGEPPWEEAVRRPNPRRQSGPDDVWRVVEAPLPSREGYRIVWVWNSLMAARDADARQARIEKAWLGIERLESKLRGPRCRFRLQEHVEAAVAQIITDSGASRWVEAKVAMLQEPIYRQERRGHPGPQTRYVRRYRSRFSVTLLTRKDIVEKDAAADGMFPLITNCNELSNRKILEAYKFQPRLEKRHEQLKSVADVAPLFLKKITRIEALLALYYIAMLVQALLEREIRRAMAREHIARLPLYPEERECQNPSTERLLELFVSLQRHRLRRGKRLVQVFEPELNDLQRQVLKLLGLRPGAFTVRA